jgi:L-threonylcarbamoyladenylate synthase
MPFESALRASEIIRKGDVVAMPTETVYGLAGDAFSDSAVKKIFSLKQRPFFDPLIVHVADIQDVDKLVSDVPKAAAVLMKAFWPGPLTLVMPKKSSVSALVTSGLETVGVRMPNHPLALELIRLSGSPLAAPSANLFGRTSPTTAAHVADEFGSGLCIVDGGACTVGLESTVVGFENGGGEPGADATCVAIYRPGAVTAEMLREALLRAGVSARVIEKESNVAPGHLKHHYMPKIPVVIVPAGSDLDVGKILSQQICEKLNLADWRPVKLQLSESAALAARELYAKLRECAESGANVIIVEKVADAETTGDMWAAIWNRLSKAATLDLTV